MLNPLRLEQKNPSEEDSSDSGSELGLEPETDRFGFFLTDGSTDGVRKAGPSPALVRQREAKWINIIDQWDRLLFKKTNKVKVQCQKGIPPSLRAKCWSLLSGASDRMKQQKDLYKLLDSQPALKHWEDVIERDLDRQFPFHEMFVSKDGHGQRNLFQVLKTFTQFKPEEGYCQAQGPVAAVLLMNMPVEEAFWCLVQICEQYLPGYYSPLLEGVLFDAAILAWVLKKSCPAAHKHLQRHGVEPLMFATDWLMCLFTRHLPFNTLLRVWDLFFCYGVRVLLQVAAVLVHRVLGREDQRKQCCGQMETLQRLRGIREEIKDEEDDFIAEVLAVPLSARDLQRQTEKELEKWQKERPSSTFDPRGRCQGYQMAWAIVRQSMEECERKGREKGNLSVPLFRSASTLSLSPSKWRKGVKGNSGEWKSGDKVVRHLSMGAKEDWRSWANLNLKKVEDLQEDDFVLIEKKKQSETGLKQETQQTELLEESENQQTEVQNVGNVPEINIDLQTEQLKENEEKEVSESTAPTGSQEENLDSNLPLTGDDIAASQQGERQSFLSKVPCQKADENDTEVDDLNKETQIFDFAAETDINVKKINTNANVQPSVDIDKNTMTEVDKNQENNNLHRIKSLKQLALEAVRTPDSNSEDEGKRIKDIEDTTERDTQQQNKETDKYWEKHSFAECQCTESLTGTEMKESHTQALIETHELTAQDNIEDLTTSNMESGHTDLKQHQTDTEKEVLSQGLGNDIQPKPQDIPDKEILVIESTVTDVNNLTEQTKVVDFPNSTNSCDHTEETNEALHKQQSSIENTDVNLNTEAVGVAISASEQCALERNIPTNVCQAAEEHTSSTSHKIEDVFTGNKQYSYRSSGDFRVRKSSSSRESRLARRLSEDLFMTPQRSNHPDEAEQTFPSLTADATDEAATHKEKQPCNPPKRFGLFRRLKEQPKKNKNQGKPQMQVPKILIQDFSDEREMGKVVTVEVDDKLTSRERRRLRREQKRKDKEEEKQRKKDKELEKEERRAQTKGKRVQVQSEKAEPQLGNANSQSTSYAYF